MLDPILEAQRLGQRYCSGGYIYAIEDLKLGMLSSGPQFPADPPPVFDGQGFPEVFELALGQKEVEIGEEVCVLGVGLVTRSSEKLPFHVRHNPHVKERCVWSVTKDNTPNGSTSLSFRTQQTFSKHHITWALELEKKLILDGRTLTSSSQITNLGTSTIPVRWFAHPFFPILKDSIYCTFNREVIVPPSEAFNMNSEKYLTTHPNYPWERGCFLPLTAKWDAPILIKMRHPKLPEVKVDCRFPLAALPVWSNDKSYSLEPYYAAEVAAQAKTEWSIAYSF